MLRFGANKVFPLLVGCRTDGLPELHVMASVVAFSIRGLGILNQI